MDDMEMKKKVLSEIMSLMDEKEGDRLKGHPKLMAAKIEVAKPGENPDDMMEDPLEEALEAPEDDLKAFSDDEDMDPEKMKAMIAMYKKMK